MSASCVLKFETKKIIELNWIVFLLWIFNFVTTWFADWKLKEKVKKFVGETKVFFSQNKWAQIPSCVLIH